MKKNLIKFVLVFFILIPNMITANAKVSKEVLNKRMYNAIRTKNLNEVKKLLDAGVSPDLMRPNGASILHAATARKQYQLVKLLLQRGANPDIVNNLGLKPIAFARNKKILDLLKNVTTLKDNDENLIRANCLVYAVLEKDKDKRTSCLVTAEYYMKKNAPWMSSWFYLAGGEIEKALKSSKKSVNDYDKEFVAKNIGHAYILKGKYKEAKRAYEYYFTKVRKSNIAMKKDYKMLSTFYTEKAERLKEGRKIWKAISGNAI